MAQVEETAAGAPETFEAGPPRADCAETGLRGSEDGLGAEAICRICFEAAGSSQLIAPCNCKGTHELVHEACLYRWRRLQVLQGKLSKAARCEICGAKYSESLEKPGKPSTALLMEFISALLTTAQGICMYLCFSPSNAIIVLLVVASLGAGFALRAACIFAVFFIVFVFLLYSKGLKLSLLGSPPHQMHLGITSFGPPVEGLAAGMLLVSIRAGGIFRQTVLYVMEYSDAGQGALAFIVNTPRDDGSGSEAKARFRVSSRIGGPLQTRNEMCVHSIEGVPGALRLGRSEPPVFLSRGAAGKVKVLESCWAGKSAPEEVAKVAVIHGISSWGEQQLDGEVRSGAWGWIRSEHVKSEDLLELEPEKLETLWERMLHSPHLEIFND